MHDMDHNSLEDKAKQMVERLASGCEDQTLGSTTVAVYDSAWVSMIWKGEDWLFPECFNFVLDNQSVNGGWESGGFLEDDILNTLVSLLAMVRHSVASGSNTQARAIDLDARISTAKISLEENLLIWDIRATMHVGFEVLVPALLSMLEREQIHFDFPGRQYLDTLNATKMAKFDAEIFYNSPNTLLHSLEGLIGRIDFDRLAHHKTFGSMMASPASTAAYLMHSSVWDAEAEIYIRTVIERGEGKGGGGIPSVFPIPVFESTWILSTLLQSGFDRLALGEEALDRIARYLQEIFQKQEGLLGFAPSVLVDSDDTAKAILVLNLLDRAATPHQMIDYFRSENGCFRTYVGERDASFSATCNALIAVLYSPTVSDFTAQIVSTTAFLCDCWWRAELHDKWNTSPQYSRMLLAEALTRLLHLWDTGRLDNIPSGLLRDRLPVTLVQVLNRTLFDQNENGGWVPEDSLETTAYGVLTLKTLFQLPWFTFFQDTVMSAIRTGQQVLSQSPDKWTKPARIWVEKVTYGSPNLAEAYCLAAMRAPKPCNICAFRVTNLATIPEGRIINLVEFFKTLERFQSEPIWKLTASAIEGFAFLPQLKSARMDILPGQKDAKNEYLDYIPLSWVLINNQEKLNMSANLLWNMMVLTNCNFRVDEYMETAVAKFSQDGLEQVRLILRDLCTVEPSNAVQMGPPEILIYSSKLSEQTSANLSSTDKKNSSISQRDKVLSDATERYSVSSLTSFRAVMGNYTRAMLTYPHVLNASAADRFSLRCQLLKFLLSHIAQLSENSRFSTQGSWNSSTMSVFESPSSSFYTWAHTTSADSISCSFSFAFFTCLLGAASATPKPNLKTPAHDCFRSVRQKYLAEDLCMHLAVMSRLYNDFASMDRDRLEANLNSTNFPEFHTHTRSWQKTDSEDSKLVHGDILKEELLGLAEHERRCADAALVRLLAEISADPTGISRAETKQRAGAVSLFVGVAMLYAEIYVARDLSNRIDG